MKWIKPVIGALCVMMAVMTGCAANPADSPITQLDKGEQTEASALKKRNTLPENGVVTAAQWKTIAGKSGTYEFTGKSDNTSYVWSFQGEQIHNSIDQNLKVSFTEDGLKQVMEEANHASVGMGFSVKKQELIGPASLTFTLDKSWDANTLILCQRVNQKVSKIADVTVGEKKQDNGTVTTLTVPLTQVNTTYYIVGGKVATKEKKESSRESAPAAQTCSVSIQCKEVLNKMSQLKKTKRSFVPKDGVILKATQVTLQKGDTVYDILQRTCKQQGIHMEASYTPGYGSYYVEGINQLYEFDCGELSGWSFYVNGWSPNYSSSEYQVKAGDAIEWYYTCNLGKD